MIIPPTSGRPWWRSRGASALIHALYFAGGMVVTADLFQDGRFLLGLLMATLLIAFALPIHRLGQGRAIGAHQAVGIVGGALGAGLAILSGGDRDALWTGLFLSIWSVNGMGMSPEFWRPGPLDRLWRGRSEAHQGGSR